MPLTFPQGLRIANRNPIDDRTVFDTLANAKSSLNTARRYRGLRIFITEEVKEYWFRDGTTNADLIEYRPGAMLYSVTSIAERNSIPLSLRSEGMEVNVLLGGGMTKYVLVGGITDACWQESTADILTWNILEEGE